MAEKVTGLVLYGVILYDALYQQQYFLKKDEFEKQIITKYHFPFSDVLAVERDLTQMSMKVMKKQRNTVGAIFFEKVHLPLG